MSALRSMWTLAAWVCVITTAGAREMQSNPLMAWTDPTSIKPDVVVRDFPTGASTPKIYESIAQCIADRNLDKLEKFSSLDRKSSDGEAAEAMFAIKKSAEQRCGGIYWIYSQGGYSRNFSVDWAFFGAAIRRSVYLAHHKTPAQMTQGYSNLKMISFSEYSWGAFMMLADCLVDEDPVQSDLYVRSKFGSTDEIQIMANLSKSIKNCNHIPGSIDTDRSYFRAIMNQAVFAHSTGLVSQVPPVVPRSVFKDMDDCLAKPRYWEALCPN